MVKMSNKKESAIVADVHSIILCYKVMDLLAGGPTFSDNSIFISACIEMRRIDVMIHNEGELVLPQCENFDFHSDVSPETFRFYVQPGCFVSYCSTSVS